MDTKEGHLKLVQGLVLDERYSLVRQLGEGTFGRVFECMDMRDGNKKKAIKVVRSVERYKQDAIAEATVLTDLRKLDPNNQFQCVQMLSQGEAYGHYFLSFDRLGPSLSEELESRNYNPFSVRRIRSFGR